MCFNVLAGEWYKGDVMAIIEEALSTGADPNISDAYTINGQPGDLYECSKGIPNLTFLTLINPTWKEKKAQNCSLNQFV